MYPHLFVDESKSRGYWLAACVVMPRDLDQLRKVVCALRLPNQRRIHFCRESDTRRKTILSVMAAAGAQVVMYDASAHRGVKAARNAAMIQLVDDAAKMGAVMLVVERDDHAVASDIEIIRGRSERAGCQDTLRYEHKRAHEECLLAIPDAAAWAWAKGGHWRRRAQGLVVEAKPV